MRRKRATVQLSEPVMEVLSAMREIRGCSIAAVIRETILADVPRMVDRARLLGRNLDGELLRIRNGEI